MTLSMATMKITVAILEDLAAYVREQGESGRFTSVSAYMTEHLIEI
jgi:Arc/MetJ-type ribon-helix-helix transcriptional regulator